jgi:phosphohistidine swiveling domain-containing protein
MEFDLGAGRWAEDPSMILELVRARLRSKGSEDVARRMGRLLEKRAGAIDEAVAASPLWKRPILRRLARVVELYMPLREAPKHYAVFVFRRARNAALELGRRLTGDGLLDVQGDVFYLEWPELVELAGDRGQVDGLRERIEVRKVQLTRYRSETPPDLYRSDGVPVAEKSSCTAPAEEGVLRGTGTSPGRAEGPVRILTEPDPRLVLEGDILVMRYADPGWTPLFPMAAAVVMEVGGLMCHAAVVAREMGIPAVFGVPGALAALQDGQVVTVDGDAGTVKLKS